MQEVLVVIPARYSSARFPGKPLAMLEGWPMIRHVWERARQAKRPSRVVVATEDDRIFQCVQAFGGNCLMTSVSHQNGTERVAEVAASSQAPLVVNLQGDLPLFHPPTLDRLIEIGAKEILEGRADLVTPCAPIETEEEYASPSCVKVVMDVAGYALYFSRAPIPHLPNFLKGVGYKHYGIYLYSREGLLKLAQRPEGPLERSETLEQLRLLENGGRVLMIKLAPQEAHSFREVNHPEDMIQAKAHLLDRMA